MDTFHKRKGVGADSVELKKTKSVGLPTAQKETC